MGIALSVRKSAFPISILLERRVFLHSVKTSHVPGAAVFLTMVCWKHLQVSELLLVVFRLYSDRASLVAR